VNNYEKIVRDNLERLYGNLPVDLENNLPGKKNESTYSFTAFGQSCILSPTGITLGGISPPGVIGNLLSLYSNNANCFMPMDGLADVGEYTSKTIIGLIN